VLCIFGVLARALPRTLPNFQHRVIQHLEAYVHSVAVHTFNLDPGQAPVDGVRLTPWHAPPGVVDFHESHSQAQADKAIAVKCRRETCAFRANYDANRTLNCMRQMFVEQQVGRFLRTYAEIYDVAIVVSSDLLLMLNVCAGDVASLAQAQASDVVFTSNVNDGEGFTDSFYIGRPLPLARMLGRYDEWRSYMHLRRDYERVIKASIEQHGLTRRVSPMYFYKVRASGVIHQPSRWLLPHFAKRMYPPGVAQRLIDDSKALTPQPVWQLGRGYHLHG